MIERYLKGLCFSPKLGRQMRFIAGPRQVGKTTLARQFLDEAGMPDLYYNWDLRSTRSRYREDPYFYNADALKEKRGSKAWICFDEIHKFPKWKNILKDAFDSFEDRYRFIVTGSARLDLFRKAGDSLSGRYLLFRLLPVSLFELCGRKLALPAGKAEEYIEDRIGGKSYQSDMEHLLSFSGFPEPLSRGDEVFSSNWHDEYTDTLVREDLRDLTKIHELENVITLMHLLPGRIGAPLSVNSLREDMDVSYNALKNYLKALVLTYVLFEVAPYAKKFGRAIKKEKKVYFFDWTQVKEESARFENFIACELKQRAELWTAATKYKFELFYVRMRDGKETDFLITRDAKPFMLIEAKLSSDTFESHNIVHAAKLGVPLVQVVQKPDVVRAGKDKAYIVSASRFLSS